MFIIDNNLFYFAEENLFSAIDKTKYIREILNITPPSNFPYKGDINNIKIDLLNVFKSLDEIRIIEGNVKAELLYLDVIRHIEKMGDHAFSISESLSQTK